MSSVRPVFPVSQMLLVQQTCQKYLCRSEQLSQEPGHLERSSVFWAWGASVVLLSGQRNISSSLSWLFLSTQQSFSTKQWKLVKNNRENTKLNVCNFVWQFRKSNCHKLRGGNFPVLRFLPRINFVCLSWNTFVGLCSCYVAFMSSWEWKKAKSVKCQSQRSGDEIRDQWQYLHFVKENMSTNCCRTTAK